MAIVRFAVVVHIGKSVRLSSSTTGKRGYASVARTGLSVAGGLTLAVTALGGHLLRPYASGSRGGCI